MEAHRIERLVGRLVAGIDPCFHGGVPANLASGRALESAFPVNI
jgi:hypothetical protein